MGTSSNKPCKRPKKRETENKMPKIVNLKIKNQSQGNQIANITYKFFEGSFELFGKEFVKNNKDKCSMIIKGKKYGIIKNIYLKEFEKYDIKEEDEILEVKLIAKEIKNSLIKLDLSSTNTQNVEDMGYMFKDCKNLINLDVSSFNTQNVKEMIGIFEGCESLVNLNLSSFNTQNIEDMRYMFKDCKSLINLDLSSFNTQNVEYVYWMFRDSKKLIKLDLSSFNTQNLKDNYWDTFKGCESLIKINLGRKSLYKVKKLSIFGRSELRIIEV